MSRMDSHVKHEVGLLNGAYEWLADTEKSYKVLTRCEIVPKTSNLLFSVRMVAEVREKDGKMRTVAQVSQTFPTSQTQTLAGLVLAMSISIERIVSHWALDAVGETRTAPQEG